MKEGRLALTAGLAGAFTASLCCAGPLLLALFGLISIPAAGALADLLFRRFWWAFVFIGVTIAASAILWYVRPGRQCAVDETVRLRRLRRNSLALALGIFIAGYLLWDFVIVESVGVHIGAWANPLHH